MKVSTLFDSGVELTVVASVDGSLVLLLLLLLLLVVAGAFVLVVSTLALLALLTDVTTLLFWLGVLFVCAAGSGTGSHNLLQKECDVMINGLMLSVIICKQK